MSGPRASLADRFLAKLPTDRSRTECWPWQATLTRDGYGRINRGPVGAGNMLAHRLSFEVFVGPIPFGFSVDHLCRNRACVNPTHLEPVTPGTNTLRGMSPVIVAHRTGLCKRGHDIEANAYVQPKTGKRQCRECGRIRRAESRS